MSTNHSDMECGKPNCCDGTGWTGDPRERCTEHYEPHGLEEFGFIGVTY